SICTRRHTDAGKLTKLIRGDLDWIVMKCLEKDRSRRYETANGLARDIQRYLADEPVEASPPSATYRLRKVAHKYRVALQVAAAFVVLLLAGTIISSWQAVRAMRARSVAVAAENLANEQRGEVERQKKLVEGERDRAVGAEKQAKVEEERA